MSEETDTSGQRRGWFLPKAELGSLVNGLSSEGYTVIAPMAVEGVIQLKPITEAAQIARGWRDDHAAGEYRLTPGDPDTYFDYVVGPDSAKRFFFPSEQRVFSLHIKGERFEVDAVQPRAPKLAILGLRPCDLQAIAIQDRVFGVGDGATFRCESETYYRQAREQALLIAVNCTRPGGTCFCDSWQTGPQVQPGQSYDLALTELGAGFVMHAGSDKGEAVVKWLPTREPSEAELELEKLKLRDARRHMGRSIEPMAVREALAQAFEHPRWDQVARRCLSCGNCTMVCPTCFCSTVSDSNDLTTDQVARTRRWESCFTHQFSYTTAGPVRQTIRGRYRQWLCHKVSTWWEQFGSSGCVGCGRCITWCPAGIDLTEEASAIARSHADRAASAGADRAESEVV